MSDVPDELLAVSLKAAEEEIRSLKAEILGREAAYKSLAEEHAKEHQLHLYHRTHRAEIWDEGFEAAACWIQNNPTPSGTPIDPPLNPYEED